MHVDPLTHGAFSVRQADWAAENALLRGIRTEVFIMEQRVPEADEWDEQDPVCLHALALDREGMAIGTARMAVDGKIGRMAVLKEWRGKGVGSRILEFLVAAARSRGLQECRLHAQSHALAFYAHHGFEAVGEEFAKAGIPHRRMRRRL